MFVKKKGLYITYLDDSAAVTDGCAFLEHGGSFANF